jgi:hypothetical protein
MKKSNKIDVKTLNRAMKRSVQKAIRVNKALELDTVLVKGNHIVRVSPDGSSKTVKKLDKSSYANGSIEPIKID